MSDPGAPIEEMGEPVITASRLRKYFPIREGALMRVVGHVRAVDGVSFDVRRGETIGVVGESGCGKTTLGRCIAGLVSPTGGGIYYKMPAAARSRLEALTDRPSSELTQSERSEIATLGRRHRVDLLSGAARQEYRRNCQLVFQDAFASLNPRHLVKDIVGRPLRIYGEASGRQLQTRVVELLESVGLGRQHLFRYPHEFSGGQQQRISIARALALDPSVIVLDEPTSSLDVSVQAQILNLLHTLQRERDITFVFVSHDLGVVQHVSDRIAVMYLGEIVEQGPAEQVFESPRHPYTAALIAANPALTDVSSERIHGLEGTVPDPSKPPQGCRFHTRCPVVTQHCGWELDDGLSWLMDRPELGETVRGVERDSAFAGRLAFDDEAAAGRAEEALTTQTPQAMRDALLTVERKDAGLSVSFRERERVQLQEVLPARSTSCILETELSEARVLS